MQASCLATKLGTESFQEERKKTSLINKQINKQELCHNVTFAIYFLKVCILRQKKNYGNSNNFTMPTYNLQKILLKN
jgi:hypothetical protein